MNMKQYITDLYVYITKLYYQFLHLEFPYANIIYR